MTVGVIAGQKGPLGWQILKLGGSGVVSGVSIHSDGTRVIRTDVGGAYVWNAATSQWDQLLNKTSLGSTGFASDGALGTLAGVYAIEICPSNSSRLYMIYRPNTDVGYVFRSDDKGQTWVRKWNLTALDHALTGENGGARTDNPKIAIDPINADVVVVSNLNNAYYTLDAGATWTQIAGIPTPVGGSDTAGQGVLVRYDPNSATSGSPLRTQGIYATSFGNGLYHTTTGPAGIWSLIASSPAVAFSSLDVAANGTVLTGNDGSGTLHRFAGSWTSPVAGVNGVRGLTFNPGDATKAWAVDSLGNLSYSSDNAVTWSGFGTHAISSPKIPWIPVTHTSDNLQPGSTLRFDTVSGLLYLGYGLGIATATPPTSATLITWNDISQGIEELIATRIIKPPGGRPVMSGWDQGVFRSPQNEGYPLSQGPSHNAGGIGAGWDIDYSFSNPNVIVGHVNFAGVETSGKSTDNAQSWSLFTGTATYNPSGNQGGMIAVSDDNNIVLVKTDNGVSQNQLFYTTDGGVSWTASTVSGVSTTGATGWGANYFDDNHTLCADRITAGTFYIHNFDATLGGIYKSVDKGANFTRVNTSPSGRLPVGSFDGASRLVAVPQNAGHLFFTPGRFNNATNSLIRSTDGGVTWTTVLTAGEVWCVGFGKPKPGGGGYPAIFMAGYVGGVFGVYRSDDNAATWNQVGADYQAPLGTIDKVNDITGDMDTYGDCYIATRNTGFKWFRA